MGYRKADGLCSNVMWSKVLSTHLRRRACSHTVSFPSISMFKGSTYDGYLVLHGPGISKCRHFSFQRYVIKCALNTPRKRTRPQEVNSHLISTWAGSKDEEFLVLHGSRISRGRGNSFQSYVIKGAQCTQEGNKPSSGQCSFDFYVSRLYWW